MLLLLAAAPAFAELPSIRFDRLIPLGGAAGGMVEVEVIGADMEDITSLWLDHPGITAAAVEGKEKGKKFRITIAADVPAGTYDVRLVGRYGVSNPRLFAVTRGLKDAGEAEPNNEPVSAQVIALNTAINGVSDGNNDDYFRITLKPGQRIVIDCQAGKLDSPMDANLAVMTVDGKQLATSSDYNGRDPLLAFVAPHTGGDGDYLIRVFDLSYRGGFPYRLLVTDKPYATSLSPRVVQAGHSAELTARGYNLGPKASQVPGSDGGVQLDELRFPLTAPADVAAQGSYRFLDHPTDHSVLPTAATFTLAGLQVRTPLEDAINVQSLVVTDSPVMLETEPNNDMEKAQKIALPLALSGRFDQPRDADWFEFEVAKSGPYAFNVYCERIKGYADPYMVVVDDQGKRVQELDDLGIRANAFDAHLRDPVGVISLTEKRKYRVLVQDRYSRGGERYQYVLTVNPAKPDFFVAVIHSQNPGPGGATVWRGGAIYLDVIVNQEQGYNGPVTLTAEGLPAGVHAMPTVIRNNSRGVFVLRADDNAADFTGPIKLIATGQRGEEKLRREVRPYTRVWTEANKNSSRPMRDLVIAVRDGAPYRLEWASERVEVEAGKKAELKLRLTRRWPDFKNEVTIQPLTFPGNFKMNNASFTGGQSELAIAIEVPNNTQPGDYTLAVLGQGQVPFNKDANAKDRPNTLVSLPSFPFTIAVKAAAK